MLSHSVPSMIRILLTLFALLMLVRVIISVVRFAVKLFSQMHSQQETSAPTRATGPLAGELERDPVCGTFVPTATALQRQVKGATVYYCSERCRSAHAGS